MKLTDLVAKIKNAALHGGDVEISSLCYDSRRAGAGALFFALRGTAADGHAFIPNAVASGAAAVVLEDAAAAPVEIPWVQVADAREAMALAAAAFYREPTAAVPTIGITGTNGKTTTTYIIEGMLAQAGVAAAVLGTVSYRFGDRIIPAPHTTPESVELQQTLRELVDLGAGAVVMEVSSHALEQRRVEGVSFDVGIFSNLTPEHLDYHGDMESYLASKMRFFTELLRPSSGKPKRRAVINLDDPAGPRIAAAAACPVVTYGLGNADVTVRNPSFSVSGIRGTLVTPLGETDFVSPLLGRFNLYNILSAVGAGVALGLPLAAIKEGIEGHRKVPGRVERVENGKGITVLVDYAHTGDALENVLRTVKEIASARIITLFGCGGDRDRTKRPVMGRIAVQFSDLAVVTSDNPRTEEPRAIIADILNGILPLDVRELTKDEATGFEGKGFVTVENRREAIETAIRAARPGDVVVLAGKGHEDYQIIGKVKYHFDDREEAARALAELP